MRTIGVITAGRSDYGIYLPVLRALRERDDIRLWVYAAAMHLAPQFGMTVRQIEADGFEIVEHVPMTTAGDSPADTVRSMAAGLAGFGEAFESHRPDLLLVLGDRFEMHAAGLAALPLRIPLAHIHGGELTFGAMDDALRHSLTKLSHLHFASTESHARRIIQLGEAPWRVQVSGAPSLDNLRLVQRLGRDELAQRVGLPLDDRFVLCTYHPATLAEEGIEPLLEALGQAGLRVIFTLPNADAGGRAIAERIREWIVDNPRSVLVDNLGTQAYFSAMHHAAAMVGNSSSGIVEAASFELPVVDVGERQRGRAHGANVLHCPCKAADIQATLATALSEDFKKSLSGMKNPYGDGNAAHLISQRLASVPLNERLLAKEFYDLPAL